MKPQVETALHQLSELVRACEQDFTSEDTEGGELPCGDDDTVADGPKDAEPTVLTFGDIRRSRDAVETLRELLKD